MYLLTEDKKPFCADHYRVTIVLSDTKKSMKQGGDRYKRITVDSVLSGLV